MTLVSPACTKDAKLSMKRNYSMHIHVRQIVCIYIYFVCICMNMYAYTCIPVSIYLCQAPEYEEVLIQVQLKFT